MLPLLIPSVDLRRALTIDTFFSIVFVHGLTGNRETTWTHKNGVFWPEKHLAVDLKEARIMTFGYDADVVKFWGMAGSNTLRDHGKSLAYAVADQRSEDEDRPIIFIAHSLGGLVVEQALLLGNKTNPELARIHKVFTSTVGILFMGTPHSGSHLAIWGRTLAEYLYKIRRTNREILGVLQQQSEVLIAVEEDFQTMLKSPNISIRIFCFYEAVAVTGVGKIVPTESAVLRQYPNNSIDANHMDMTKFGGGNDAGYSSVRGVLKEWLKLLEQTNKENSSIAETPSKGADAAIGRGGHVYSGTVYGNALQGNQEVGHDMTINLGA